MNSGFEKWNKAPLHVPIVLSATGGMASAAQVTFKRMVSMLATKRDQPYSQVMNIVRCMLNFSLIKSQTWCIKAPD